MLTFLALGKRLGQTFYSTWVILQKFPGYRTRSQPISVPLTIIIANKKDSSEQSNGILYTTLIYLLCSKISGTLTKSLFFHWIIFIMIRTKREEQFEEIVKRTEKEIGCVQFHKFLYFPYIWYAGTISVFNCKTFAINNDFTAIKNFDLVNEKIRKTSNCFERRPSECKLSKGNHSYNTH